MIESHGRSVMQGPSRHLVAERCTIIRGDDFVAGSLAAYKQGRNPYRFQSSPTSKGGRYRTT